jgi:protein ImuB
MPLAEAEAILQRAHCQPTHLDEHNPQADLDELEQLATRCEQFSSLVGLENDPQPASLLLDIAGTAGLLGGEDKLAQRIVYAFRNCGYLVRVGIADTMGAAWAVAHFEKLTHAQQPASLPIPHIEIVPPAEQVAALGPLPIEALRLNAETVTLLSQLGVTQVRQLLQLPRSGLRARFGDVVLKRLDQASGQADEVIHTYRPTAALEVFFSLEHATDRQETIEQLLHQLITELSFRLKEQHRGVIQLESELTSTERRSIVIHVGLFRPTADVQHLFDLVRMQLERKTLTAPIQEATVRATLTSRLADKQRAILNELSPHVSQQLAHLVERLSSRLGRDRVVTTRLLAEPQPERNYRYESLAGQTSRHSGGTSTAIAKNAATAGLRPLRLYPAPIPLRTIELTAPPTRTWTVHPAAFQHRGQTHQIAHSWGPERIETGWWRGPTIRRDYFRVEDEQGCRYWIFRDLERQKWFLHGFFE